MMIFLCLTYKSNLPSYGVIGRCEESKDDSNGSYHMARIFRNEALNEEMKAPLTLFRNSRDIFVANHLQQK